MAASYVRLHPASEALTSALAKRRAEPVMIVPDVEFMVILKANTEGGRKWIADRMLPNNSMWSGVCVRSVECANRLGNEAVAAGLRITGLVEAYSFEGPRGEAMR